MKVNIHNLFHKESGPHFVSYIIDDYEEYQKGIKRPGVIICPGGGYLKLSEREGEPVALTFLQKGCHAFVLRYSTGIVKGKQLTTSQQALLELAMTVRMIYDMRDQWMVDTSNLIIVGFSAGAHLAAVYSSRWSEGWLAEKLDTVGDKLRVKAVVLGYPLCDIGLLNHSLKKDANINSDMKAFLEQSIIAICGEKNPGKERIGAFSPVSLIKEDTLPAFIWHTADDEMISAENALQYAIHLAQYHIPYELHIFESGVHGLALANEFTACRPEEINRPCQEWVPLLFHWLESKL